jgi:endonuclease/exonuclease/phosphatase family metal-dependent hydrolase
MRRNLLFFVLILFLFSCSDDFRLDVISLNVRYDNPSDTGNEWTVRKDILVDFLIEEQPELIGLQEVLWHQYEYIDSMLDAYGSVAAGRSDGLKAGEMTPVFYNKKRFDLMDQNTFWLSETPSIPGSKGWGAVLPRIVTWAKLYDNFTAKELYFFNTHFSHMSDSARIMSARILSRQVELIAGDRNFIICGDFNMRPDSRAYKEMLSGDSNIICDSFNLLETEIIGPVDTYNGFNDEEEGSDRIDYIFVKEGTGVYTHQTVKIKKDSVFISDHWPVIVKIGLN